MIDIIVAAAKNNTIGYKGKIPWKISEDLKRFKATTWGHPIIMGRKTFESIGKPLPGRRNIIITKSPIYSIECYKNLEEAIDNTNEPFIIGGERLYKAAMKVADRIFLTRVHKNYKGDARFPEISDKEWILLDKSDQEGPVPYSYELYTRRISRSSDKMSSNPLAV